MRADEPGGSALRPVPDISGPALGGDRSPIPDDERIARADRYFNGQLNRQRDWYSRRASDYKKWSQRLSIAVIAFGALVTVIQVFNTPASPSWWAPVLTALLGQSIVLLMGAQRIWKFDESWNGYRRASEKMRREYRLYINNVEPYFLIPSEDEAYRIFISNGESIISEEQQLGSPQ